MSEARRIEPELLEVGERLAREVGILAGRLAQFLSGSLSAAEGAIAEGRSFLWAAYEAISGGRPLESWTGGPLERRPEEAAHPLDRLAEVFALTPEETELLLLAGMAEEHEGFAAVLRTLHPHGAPFASVGLAAQLFCRGLDERLMLRKLLESGTIVTSGVLRVRGDGPLFERSLEPCESLWAVLHGLDVWPASIQKFDGPVAVLGLDEWLRAPTTERAARALARREPCTVMVTADSEDVAFHRARAMVEHAGLESASLLLGRETEAETERQIEIHSLVRGVVPIMRLPGSDGQPGAAQAPEFNGYPHALVLCGRSGATAVRGARPLLAVPVERLSARARRQMWSALLPELSEHAPALAARHPLEPAAAVEVLSDIRLLGSLNGGEPKIENVSASIRARGGLVLSGGVKLVRPRATFDDLVLAPDRRAQLHEAIMRLILQARVFDEWGFLKGRVGARGVRMLFAGPPGTGKTLSAEVMAHTLDVDLLVVDISRVVSKWIGETEKNLAEVFETAERAQAVLFFDEADALFGKRTEVSDAHDRYANLETAYLLARLERFEGLAILATNLRQNIDPAFLRRLEFVVDFDEPDREERYALWRCHLPPDAPLAEDVNLYEMATLYPVVGGVIRNAVAAAGFLAAADGTPLIQSHFVHAIRREYEKAGRAFPGVPAGIIVP